jgi:phosphate transport system substrate-binding protein
LPEYVPEEVLDRRLRSVGSDTMDHLMELWERSFQRWHAQVVFRHEGKGSDTAMPALAEGLSHFGPISRPIKPAEERIFQSEFGYKPTQVCVAIDALAVYVHPSNPVAQRGLSLAELDAIFSSTRKRGYPRELRAWGDLGLTGEWADAPIHVFSRNAASGTYSVFRNTVLEGGDYKPTNQELISSNIVVNAVAGDRHGIGSSGIGFLQPGVVTVALSGEPDVPRAAPTPEAVHNGSYPLARFLYLLIDCPPGEALSPLQREFLRFVYSKQGQSIVAEAGFFPLNAELAARELERVGVLPGKRPGGP